MPHKATRSSTKLDRPFDPHVLRIAREAAKGYRVVIEFEDGEYFGRGVELPLVMNDGKTASECEKSTRESLTTAVAYFLEKGQDIPWPARGEK